jgi:zinc transport system permease protein
MMLVASVLSALLTTSGLAISYGPSLPPGATVIVLAGGLYLVVMLLAHLRTRLRTRAAGRTAKG